MIRAWGVALLAAGFVAAGTQSAAATTQSVQRMYDDKACSRNADYFRVWSDDHPSAPLCFTGGGSLNVSIYHVTKVESGAYKGSVNADGPGIVTFEPHTAYTSWQHGRAVVTRVTLTGSLVCPNGC
jgi:hypothetical protein